jgi:hypothetical protein
MSSPATVHEEYEVADRAEARAFAAMQQARSPITEATWRQSAEALRLAGKRLERAISQAVAS